MTRLADLPVQRKLGFAMLFTSSFALLAACAVFLAVQYVNYRRHLIQSVQTMAQVTAGNSTAPIAFSDSVAARQTLETLRADPQIVAAVLFNDAGQVVARYAADPAVELPTRPPGPAGITVDRRTVVVVQPVVEGTRHLGMLYLAATQKIMVERLQTSAWVALAVMGFSIAVAATIAVTLGRTLARPILELDRIVSAVSADQDYSRRARQYGGDELGRLTVAFNTMMATTQKSVEALRESEQRFRVLADSAPVFIWLTDARGQYVWFNERWLDFTGRELAVELGRRWMAGIHPDDHASTLQIHEENMARQQAFQCEFRLLRHDGQYRWVLSQGLPRFDSAGTFSGFIGSALDVSDRKLGEQALAEARDRAVAASKAKDNFLAALSHELRTPLTPVLLLSTEEATNPRLSPEVRADFEMIAKNVALEARLIDDLLDLTRITRGKLVLEKKRADAHLVLEDALTTVQPDFAAKRVELTVELAAPRHHLEADTVRLQQVFWNVLKNAAKFTPVGGVVTVESSVVDGDRLLVRVTDNGLGMTTAELGRIFEAFVQGDHAETSASHRFGGLGMGLAISQRLVELHHGTIRAYSAGRNQGATFEIELPLSKEAAVAAVQR